MAVVVDAEGLTSEQMQRFTRWTNLSEATFLLPPTDPAADYRVRIFTAAGELPFAGHPTLGSCHAWLARRGQPRDASTSSRNAAPGLVPIRRTDGRLAFQAPPLRRSGPVAEADLARVARVLRIERDGHHRQPVGGQRARLGGRHAGLRGGGPGRLAGAAER